MRLDGRRLTGVFCIQRLMERLVGLRRSMLGNKGSAAGKKGRRNQEWQLHEDAIHLEGVHSYKQSWILEVFLL